MSDTLNHHESIEESTLSDIAANLAGKKPMKETETKYGNSYYYGASDDKPVSLEAMLQTVKGAEIDDLYVHIPFCIAACSYCTYPKMIGPSEGQVASYIRELRKEISKYKQLFGFSGLKTIHVGGGTPNFLNLEQLSEVLGMITSEFPTRNLKELAIEVSPVGLNEDKLRLILSYGFNRISIGIQTFDDGINEQNGRKGQRVEEAIRLVGVAKKYFPNVSIDLLAGQQGQTAESSHKDAEKALKLGVNSVYLYQVRQSFKDGGMEEILALNDFLNYFSSNGYEILSHNHIIKKRNSDGYCEQRGGRARMENLLGIGPGAVSEIEGHIFKNIRPANYLAEGAQIDEGSIKLRADRNIKAMFLVRSLRYFTKPDVNGMLVEDYVAKFGSSPYDDFKSEIDFMKGEDLIKTTPKKIEVTSKGILFTQWVDNFLTKHYK